MRTNHIIHIGNRDTTGCLKTVKFGNTFAAKITSVIYKSYILERLLTLLLPLDVDEPPFSDKGVLHEEFPKEPIDGRINVCFEWLDRYTYIQHNYILFAFTIPKRDDCSELEMVSHLKRKCVVFIDKATKDIYLTKFRFGNNAYKGTILDGVLVKDNAKYPPLLQNYKRVYLKTKHIEGQKPLIENYDEIIDRYSKVEDGEDEEGEDDEDDEDEKEVEDQAKPQRPIIIDPEKIYENLKKVTKPIDYNSLYQTKKPYKNGVFVFFVQAVYALGGEQTDFSEKPNTDAISYGVCLKLHTDLLGNPDEYIEDLSIQPAILKNSVDTMYYTRHTKVHLRNPLSNDFLRYHPPYVDFRLRDTSAISHFFPLFDDKGNVFSKKYELFCCIKCTVIKTDFVYVFRLESTDTRFDQNANRGYAKVWTYEGTRYLRVIFHKIHPNRNLTEQPPVRMHCVGVRDKDTKKVIGYTPVRYPKKTRSLRSTMQRQVQKF